MNRSTTSHRDTARQLEADAARYPEARGEVLLEAAHQWQLAGNIIRAVAVLRQVLALGGQDAEYAHYELAQICFERGADVDAWAHLDALEARGSSDAGPPGLVAELLEERGEYRAALCWFDRAIGLLDAEELAAIGQHGRLSLDAGLLFGRQRCRRALGLLPDALDRAADVAELNRLDFARQMEHIAGDTSEVRQPALRMLVWQRDEQKKAAQRWPHVFVPSVIGNHATIEDYLRAVRRDKGITQIVLVPGDVEDFARYLERTGGAPDDEDVRLAYSKEAAEQGRRIPWPPARNQPCWCGSGRKYKTCCAAPPPPRAEPADLSGPVPA